MSQTIVSKINELHVLERQKKDVNDKLEEQRKMIAEIMDHYKVQKVKITNRRSIISTFTIKKIGIRDANVEIITHTLTND